MALAIVGCRRGVGHRLAGVSGGFLGRIGRWAEKSSRGIE